MAARRRGARAHQPRVHVLWRGREVVGLAVPRPHKLDSVDERVPAVKDHLLVLEAEPLPRAQPAEQLGLLAGARVQQYLRQQGC